jgi:hypothetical protein
MYLLSLFLGAGFTGTYNSALNAGTAKPFGIAPAKPVAYGIEVSTTGLMSLYSQI